MRVAVTQTAGVSLDQWRRTLAVVEGLIAHAAAARAELVVLPECAWPAYCLGSGAAYRAARAAGLPGPEQLLQDVQAVARREQIHVCIGYVREDGARLYNAATLVSANGRVLGTRDKCFLWAFDRDYFAPGDDLTPIETEFGRVGVLICADARLPELAATLAARGAELFVQPTAWVNVGDATHRWNPQPEFLIHARAAEFGVPMASASKWGREQDTEFVGGSLICDAAGRVLARCEPDRDAVAVAVVQLSAARPPELTPTERAIVCAAQPARRPTANVAPLTVQPLPTDVENESGAAGVRDCEPGTLLFAPPTGGTCAAGAAHAAHGLFVRGPVNGPIAYGDVGIGVIASADARRFAPLRCLALQGVHLALVYGDDIPDILLQTRACENRIFVIHAAAERWRVCDPRGRFIHTAPWPRVFDRGQALSLELAGAARKDVAPGTDVLADRRTDLCAF